MIVGVAAVVPLVTVLALFGRPLPPILPTSAPAPDTDAWTALDPDERVHALIETDGSQEWLHLMRDGALAAPDILVYWAHVGPAERTSLPDDATLLGALGDTGRHSFDLPLRDTPGTLLLYSLGHRAVLTATPVGRIARLDRSD
jgi:hypothetical protein